MGDFYKIPSAAQIAVADMVIVWSLSSFVLAVWNTIRPGTFGMMSLRGAGNWVWFLLGFALLAWMLREIFKPRVKGDVWRPTNVGLPGLNTFGEARYSFCSTHPSYVFLDFVAVAVNAFFVWYAASGHYAAKHLYIMLAVSLIIPALRLLAWYGLGLRIEDQRESRRAWKPVSYFIIPVLVVFGAVSLAAVVSGRKQQQEIANLPVIDGQTFAHSHEAFAHLVSDNPRDKSEIRTAEETGFVRLRARQISAGATQCKNKDNIEFASVLADLGAGGDVLIVGANYSRSGFEELVKKSSGNQGKPIEVIGKLREMPLNGAPEAWKAYCGMEKLPPTPAGGRWVLEMHEP